MRRSGIAGPALDDLWSSVAREYYLGCDGCVTGDTGKIRPTGVRNLLLILKHAGVISFGQRLAVADHTCAVGQGRKPASAAPEQVEDDRLIQVNRVAKRQIGAPNQGGVEARGIIIPGGLRPKILAREDCSTIILLSVAAFESALCGLVGPVLDLHRF